MKKQRLFVLIISILFVSNTLGRDKIVFTDAKVKAGNAPEWREKNFDERDWVTIQLNRDWDSQGFADYDGFAFYRMRFNLPSEMLKNAYWKDSVIVYMGKIDDADEVYLNGKLIGKSGSFPNEKGGYRTAFSSERFYKLAADNPALEWGKENVLAVKVFDYSGPGGLYEGFPYIRMIDLTDVLPIKTSFGQTQRGNVCNISLTNNYSKSVAGSLTIETLDTETDSLTGSLRQKLTLKPAKTFNKSVPYSQDKRYCLRISFTDDKTGVSVTENVVVPYILTPKASAQPQINGAKVFGVRPGSPFLFKIPASGQKPIRYAVENLPQGLTVDAGTGIITGVLNKAGEYRMTFVAENSQGKAKREFTAKVGDLLALTPPMGWNSWNCWGVSVSDEKVRSSAQALVDKGLIDYGWTYINIDDAWESAERDANGKLGTNSKFPDMKALGDWLHSLGLRFGIYSSPGPLTCGKYLGSYRHEQQDAELWASWGIDYLKYDWCDYGRIYDREKDNSLSAHLKPYQVMEKALKAQNRDIVYSLCQYGMRDVWQWGAAVNGNLWRTTGDIVDTWASLKDIGFDRQAELAHFAKPGRWNDPDMLIVGKVGWSDKLRQTRLTCDEQYTHISLWCLLAAPMLLGCDISQLDDFTLNLLTNAEVIAVNQDVLGKQAERLVKDGDMQIWVKPLEDGSYAAGIFNLAAEDKVMEVKWADLKLPESANVRDIWRQKELGVFQTAFKAKIPSHGVKLIKIYK
ncbi:MAG: putative Ig domain-containing protein [Prevotella sp.]|jgi:hypothetical protein|nr:putative Ig domain-containing protein [Prevotella sp.]